MLWGDFVPEAASSRKHNISAMLSIAIPDICIDFRRKKPNSLATTAWNHTRETFLGLLWSKRLILTKSDQSFSLKRQTRV